MYLVKDILNAFNNKHNISGNYGGRAYSESEIKRFIGKARRDYGTTNNTLRRLCKHGVLNRFVGLSNSKRPSWMYEIVMEDKLVASYIRNKEAEMAKYKQKYAKNQQLFNFGYSHTITTSWNEGSPIMIGVGLAPDGMENRCLVVHSSYEMEITENEHGGKVISFRKKSM